MVEKRAAFHAVKHLLPGKKLVFLDEAHIKLAQDRKHGWAKKGHKPVLRGTNCVRLSTTSHVENTNSRLAAACCQV